MLATHDKPLLYIGLMSGTSADGIDLALVDFSENTPKLKASFYQAYDEVTRTAITTLYTPNDNEIDLAFTLDIQLAKQFAQAITTFIEQQKLTSKDIIAIGNHGQTIRHRPVKSDRYSECFTVQIGCSQTLAVLTGIRVVGQFRQKDIALGGQGAPLVPAFHKVLFTADQQDVFVVNIGGVANISYLPNNTNAHVLGFDTGPGNALLDDWFQVNHLATEQRFDLDGNWAKSGNVDLKFLQSLLSDRYFSLSAPKSTGREYFNLTWLEEKLAETAQTISPEDIQATLVQLTAQSISDSIESISASATIYVCGGGLQNSYLLSQLQSCLSKYRVVASNSINIDSDSLEAMAFAWLAYAYDNNINSNMPEVTGANRATVLGTSYSC